MIYSSSWASPWTPQPQHIHTHSSPHWKIDDAPSDFPHAVYVCSEIIFGCSCSLHVTHAHIYGVDIPFASYTIHIDPLVTDVRRSRHNRNDATDFCSLVFDFVLVSAMSSHESNYCSVWKRVTATATAASRRSCLPFEKCWCGSNWIGHCFPSKAKMATANATLRAYAIRFCSFRFVRQFILCIPLNKARRRLKASEKFSACRIVCARSCKISFPKCVCVWESFECTQTLSFMCRFGVDSISDKNKLYT